MRMRVADQCFSLEKYNAWVIIALKSMEILNMVSFF